MADRDLSGSTIQAPTLSTETDADERRRFLGSYLKRCRNEIGLTGKQIKERTGISPSHLSNIEAGRADVATETLELLASELGLDTDAVCSLAGVLPSWVEPLLLSNSDLIDLLSDYR